MHVCVTGSLHHSHEAGMTHPSAGAAPADVLLNGDCCARAPGIEGCPGRLPPAQLRGLAEAAAGKVATHSRLNLDGCVVSLQGARCLSIPLHERLHIKQAEMLV